MFSSLKIGETQGNTDDACLMTLTSAHSRIWTSVAAGFPKSPLSQSIFSSRLPSHSLCLGNFLNKHLPPKEVIYCSSVERGGIFPDWLNSNARTVTGRVSQHQPSIKWQINRLIKQDGKYIFYSAGLFQVPHGGEQQQFDNHLRKLLNIHE